MSVGIHLGGCGEGDGDVGEGRDDNCLQYVKLEVCMAQPTIQQAAGYMGTECRGEWGWSRVVEIISVLR